MRIRSTGNKVLNGQYPWQGGAYFSKSMSALDPWTVQLGRPFVFVASLIGLTALWSDEMRIHSTDTNATNGQYPWTVLTTAWAMQVGFGVGTTCASTIISNNFALSNLRCAGQE
ncbi:hypothetical protein HA402_015723 [Bradysia odoriphaga]|nr:hypothetical protein HA402_015723 [Bradysia odoriphaga]